MQAAVLMADLAGFTAMTEVHGDDLAAEVGAQLLDSAAPTATTRLLTKGLGDGVLVIDRDPERLAHDALDLHHRIATARRLPALCIALHHGPVVPRGGDYYGRAINLVARLAETVEPGQVVATQDFVNAMGAPADLLVVRAGHATLRDLEEPVAVHQLHEADHAHPFVIDPVCRMALDPEDPDMVVHRVEGQPVHFCSTTCAEQYTSGA